jgi:hypothetical protein
MSLPVLPRLRVGTFPRFTQWIIAFISVTSVILVVFHTWYWHQGISVTERTIEDWFQTIKSEGGIVRLTNLRFSGYPLAFEVKADSIAIQSASTGAAWTWRGGAIHGRAGIWSPNIITANLSDGHEWHSKPQGTNKQLRAGLVTAVAEIEISNSRIQSLNASLTGIHVVSTALAEHFTIESLDISGFGDLSPSDPPLLRLQGQARQTQLPIIKMPGLGSVIEKVTWNLYATGILPKSLGEHDIATWRDNGGTINVELFSLQWGILTINAEGTLSLDKRNRPIAALSATVRGHRAVIDSLVQFGQIRPVEGAAAKIGLGAFSESAENGGIVLPLTAQSGWLAAGPLRIFPLQPLDFSWLRPFAP